MHDLTPHDDSPATVLIVEDDPEELAVVSTILKQRGYIIASTPRGERAVELATLVRPDVVLLDVMLPGVDGFEVMRRLRAEPETHVVPVIFLSGFADVETETRGLEAGAADFIRKPFNRAVVAARVRNQVELKRSRERLESYASRDGLTGIANRRVFDETLEREFRRLSRTNGWLSLLLLDVDHFKAYNDHYGHLAGDECLRRVASCVATTLKRPGDLAARYGGEEFACILPETDIEGAALVAERVRAAIAGMRLPHAFSRAAQFVTVSVGGIASGWTPFVSAGDLLKAVDERLYEAKRAGRNRAVTAAFEPQTAN